MADSAAELTDPDAEMPPRSDQIDRRRSLIDALAIDLSALPRPARAAIEALTDEVLALREDQLRLRKELEIAELLADRDTLCPVFNRRAFERELTREIALAQRFATPLSLIYIDLDRFKLINDRFGHATGDRVIQHVAQTLLDNIRQTDIVGRLGGDEFAVALTHAPLVDSQIKAAALEGLIDSLTVRDDRDTSLAPVQLGGSCGAVEWQVGMTAAKLISSADEAMFRAKAKRKQAR